MFVTKASGEKEEFNPEKIRSTCIRAGATKWLADAIVKEVEKRAYDGIPTKKILQITLKILNREMPRVAAKYDLKFAIMRLGPAGFLFEQLVAELLSEYGYETRVHSIIYGGCISHEIDVVAEKDGKRCMIECKYHNAPGIYTGVKEALYTQARFEDLLEGSKSGKCQRFDQVWLVCNTKFSADVIAYALCKKIKLLGWKYPEENLRTMLEKKNLYPITVLRKLDSYSQKRLASVGLMFCKDLLKRDFSELRELTKIPPTRLKFLIQEAESICR